ncbi:MAG: zinc ribbon domain-containing protein [Prolixibacteraceae bacterium]|nr:zinc ribbon domain-containing protein [Prolixibacteraceae bacterium]
MNTQSYKCVKCGSTDYLVEEIRTTGGALAKFFDVQNKKFTVVSCTRCGYSELYRRTTSTIGNVVDFLAGG